MKTYLISIGVDTVDQNYYNGLATLNCCEKDAEDFTTLLTSRYDIFSKITYVNETAEVESILRKLDSLSGKLKAEDNLIIYYSGHGSQVGDINNDEPDELDETWCLYDRMLVDDELYNEFRKFAQGVKIWMISDSCHSGTVSRDLDDTTIYKTYRRSKAEASFQSNQTLHENLKEIKVSGSGDIEATILQFGACQDAETAQAGSPNSLFTEVLLSEIEKADGNISILDFFESLSAKTTSHPDNRGGQSPNYYCPNESSSSEIDNLPLSTFFKKKEADEVVSYSWNQELLIDANGSDIKKISQYIKEESLGEVIENLIDDMLLIKVSKNYTTPWDAAYDLYQQLSAKGIEVYIEPLFVNKVEVKETATAKGEDANIFLSNWAYPVAPKTLFNWHLEDGFSQLGTALKTVTEKFASNPAKLKVRIAHIDTGYLPEHPSTPKNTLKDLGRSFIDGEVDNKAIDIEDNVIVGAFEQDYHGVATLSLLAGNEAKDGNMKTYGSYEGFVGAIPFAEILPIRIGDKVALLGAETRAFVKAVKYAIKHDCDVISMSMAGAPCRAMAKAVNEAYRNGIVVVSAAGNNFKTPIVDLAFPEHVIYPARYERVIAATGVTYDHTPYDFGSQGINAKGLSNKNMQGNWGPPSAMKTALAAYTPNVPGAAVHKNSDGNYYYFRKSGGGTSSATPQIAAAAALYIVYHREELEELAKDGKWKKAEAVRQALFAGANKDLPNRESNKKYYGAGIIRAYDALSQKVPAYIDENKKPRKASESWFQLDRFVNLYNPWAKGAKDESEQIGDSNLKKMLCAELEQVLSLDPKNQRVDFNQVSTEVINEVKNSSRTSAVLKNALPQ